MNVNNLTINKAPQNIIRSTVNVNEGNFANMLINATEKLNLIALMGSNGDNLSADNIDNILNEQYVELEEGDENNHANYKNIYMLSDIFLYRPTFPTDEVITDNKSSNNVAAYENQFLHRGIDYTNRLQEKQEIAFIKQDSVVTEKIISEKFEFNSVSAEKLITGMNEQTEKPKIEFDLIASSNEIPLAENKIIQVTDQATEIKATVLSQVKDKIIIMTEKDSDSIDVQTVRMQLQPQNLGKVDIKMIFEDNKLTVEIKALNEETQKILSSNTDELKEMLGKTSESVKIVVKPYAESDNHSINNYQNQQGREQNFYQEHESNFGQGRHRNNYYRNTKEGEEDVFSELINLNTLEPKEDILGNKRLYKQ